MGPLSFIKLFYTASAPIHPDRGKAGRKHPMQRTRQHPIAQGGPLPRLRQIVGLHTGSMDGAASNKDARVGGEPASMRDPLDHQLGLLAVNQQLVNLHDICKITNTQLREQRLQLGELTARVDHAEATAAAAVQTAKAALEATTAGGWVL